MKILFLNSTIPNYLTDSLFHGLKLIQGINVIDIPRIDYMYLDANKEDLDKTGSKGNTLYKLLSEEFESKGKRTFWQREINEYDYIIFTDIFQQFDLFYSIYQTIHPSRIKSLCILDGYDATAMFPFFNFRYNLKTRPWSYFNSLNKVKYFKREFVNTGETYGIPKEQFPIINKIITKLIKKPSKLFPISMSIPEEHIEYIPFGNKNQEFVNYNVDNDLEELFPERPVAELGKWQPSFNKQDEYFNDIKRSKFGITARRAGWDCLRHYEYAAKGAILCFKNLNAKDQLCAPFDLNQKNCINYTNKEDLLYKIKNKSIQELESIQESQYEWINRYTTRNVALRFLDKLNS